MDSPIIAYVRISNDSLVWPQGDNLDPMWAPKTSIFWLISKELCDFSDLGLTLFDISKDAFFAENFVFGNIFGFLAINWTPKCTKAVDFGCVSFEPKRKILKDFSKTMFFLLETSAGQNFSKIEQYLEGKSPPPPTTQTHTPKKGGHFMDAESIRKTLKVFNFTTTCTILMKLTMNMYLN